MQLRPYQTELIDAVWKELFTQPTALAQLPTGGGKTLCFSHLLARSIAAKPDIRIVVLMGRIELVSQTERALARVIDRKHIGVYCGSLQRKELGRNIIVASIQSIADVQLPYVNMVIVDEVHNLDQKGGSYMRFIEKTRKTNSKLKVVGFTATPFRADGMIHGSDKIFPYLCYRKTIRDMIDLGFLCRPVLKQGENAFDTRDLRIRAGEYMQEDIDKLVSNERVLELQVAEALKKMEGRRAVAWATANIDHCNRVLKELQKNELLSATCVHSKQVREVRNASLAAFTNGSCRHMVFVSVLSEGFDYPPIDCVVLMRPTRSPVLYVQTVGRGLRIADKKENCLVLDYGQVVRELGPLDDPKVKGKKGEGEAVLKVCPQCQSWVPGGCGQCPDCGFMFPPPPAPEEKLTKRSDDNAKILSDTSTKPPEPERETCGPVYIEMHQAKSGNQCVKITYSIGGVKTPWGTRDGTQEFFVTTSPWAMQRLEQRLEMIETELPEIPFMGEKRVDGVFEIVKLQDGKFWRVLSARRTGDAGAPKEEEIDTSFEFGANVAEPKANSPADIGW